MRTMKILVIKIGIDKPGLTGMGVGFSLARMEP